eukprot:jgi/Chrzof1/2818/UNPLg00736.t1
MDGKLDIIPESLKDPRAVMERTQRIITGIVETDYSIRLKHEDFVWSHSKNDVKLSLHLVIATREPQYVYSSNHFKDPGGAKHLATRIMAMDPELGQIVDDGVYTKDRAMRMVNSCKHGKSSMLELVDTHGEYLPTYRDSVVTWLDECTETIRVPCQAPPLNVAKKKARAHKTPPQPIIHPVDVSHAESRLLDVMLMYSDGCIQG